MLNLHPMTGEDFQHYLRRAIPQYAIDQTRSGNWKPEEAVGRARAEFQQTLGNGLETPGNYFYSIVTEAGQKVGMIWWVANQRGSQNIAFVADFFIFGEFRHLGYEQESLDLLLADAKDHEMERIELQVFAHNVDDLALYKAGGFQEVSIYLGKNISG